MRGRGDGSNRAVFVDRDGVINVEVEYLQDPDQLLLLPRAAEAIAALNRLPVPVIVVTNQAGVARGYFSEDRVREIHQALQAMLGPADAHVDAFYYCPHHPTAGQGAYRLECECRKPQPGMLRRAALDFGLDLSRCFLVGDKASDIGAGHQAGCTTVLVETGYGADEWRDWQEAFRPDRVEPDLWFASQWIVERLERPPGKGTKTKRGG